MDTRSKQNFNSVTFSRLVPCALALLCLTALIAPATAKPYTASEMDLFDDQDNDKLERQELIRRIFAFNERLGLRPDLEDPVRQIERSRTRDAHRLLRKRFKPIPSGRSGGVSLCLWKVCPAAPWLMSKRPREMPLAPAYQTSLK